MRPLPPDTRLGPLAVIRLLGAGSMGTVYLARVAEATTWAPAGRLVAAKIVRQDAAAHPTTWSRAEREVAAGRAVAHPGLVKTLSLEHVAIDSVEHRVIVLEHVEGTSLAELLAATGPLAEPLVRHVGASIARALAALHGAGIVHRDLKPSNVLITDDHEVKVADLGVARLRGGLALTDSGDFVGTAHYAAPEQFSSAVVGPAADLHALGATLFEAATGRRPFGGGSWTEAMGRLLREPAPPPSSIVPALSRFFDAIVLALLEKEASARPASATVVAEALEQGEASAWCRDHGVMMGAPAELQQFLRPPDIPRFGRDGELASLRDRWRLACEGRGGSLVIAGEAGAGKSRLVADFVRGLVGTPAAPRILLTAGEPPPAPVAGPWDVIAAQFPGDLTRGLLASLPDAPHLAEALGRRWSGRPGDGDMLTEDSEADGVARLLKAWSRSQPVLWIVEDLHYVSSALREQLPRLASACEDAAVLIVSTTRAEAAPREERRKGDVLRLPPLDPEDTRQLVAHALGGVAGSAGCEDLVERSDGNPLFALELARQAAARDERGDGDSNGSVPRSVAGLLRRRMDSLVPQEREILDAACVQGFEFEPRRLARVLDRPDLAVLQALTRIHRQRALVRPSGTKFRFAHHLLQEVLLAELPEALRASLHSATADALEKEPFAEGAGGERSWMLALHRLQGTTPREGLGHWHECIAWMNQRGDVAGILRACELALPATAADDTRLRAEVLLHMGKAVDMRSDGRRALELLGQALDEARRSGDAALVAAVLQQVGVRHSLAGRAAAAEEALREAIALAGPPGDGGMLLSRRMSLAAMLLRAHRDEEAKTMLTELVRDAEEAGNLVHLASGLNNLGILALRSHDLADAAGCFERAHELRQRTGDHARAAGALSNLALVASNQGDLDKAARLAREAVTLAARCGDVRQELIALTQLALALQALGRLAEARAELAAQRAAIEASGHLVLQLSIAATEAEASLMEGRLDVTRRLCEESLARGPMLVELPQQVVLATMLAEAAVASGDDSLAEAESLRALRLACDGASGGEYLSAVLSRVLILLDLAREDEALSLVDAANAAQPKLHRGADWQAVEALLGRRSPGDVTLESEQSVPARCTALLLLARATGQEGYLSAARRELRRLVGHLSGAQRERAMQCSPLGRRLARTAELLAKRPESMDGTRE